MAQPCGSLLSRPFRPADHLWWRHHKTNSRVLGRDRHRPQRSAWSSKARRNGATDNRA